LLTFWGVVTVFTLVGGLPTVGGLWLNSLPISVGPMERCTAPTQGEYTSPRFHALLGHGYSWALYEAAQAAFGTWFGEPVPSDHAPPRSAKSGRRPR
jgi:hypothetical protein